MKSRKILIDDAIGLPLAYDLTEVVPGKKKGAVLRRGHVIEEKDLPILERIGKSFIRVLDLEEGEVHEDEAALRLATLITGSGLEVSMPGEAWADVRSTQRGLLKVDVERLLAVNLIGDLLVTTRHNNTPVCEGDLAAKAKVLGLVTRKENLKKAESLTEKHQLLRVLPFRSLEAGLVITGNEVYTGRIKDGFSEILQNRLEFYGSRVGKTEIVPDRADHIARAIRFMLEQEQDLVLVTGGMSPDDSSPEGISRSGAKVAFYGAPTSPGAMSLLAYADDVPILGVPAGLLRRPRGFLDLILPRLLAGERLNPRDAAGYGHGGLCWSCEVCVFPACPLGKIG